MNKSERSILLVIAALGSCALSAYVGYKQAYTSGVVAGFAAGEAHVQITEAAEKMAEAYQVVPKERRMLVHQVCKGFRSKIPCSDTEEAVKQMESSDPSVLLRGKTCFLALNKLGECGQEAPEVSQK